MVKVALMSLILRLGVLHFELQKEALKGVWTWWYFTSVYNANNQILHCVLILIF